jgi:O-succinylbenzoic acid--CoA ligase
MEQSLFYDLKGIPPRLSLPEHKHLLDAFSFISEWQSGKEWFSLQTSGSTGTPKKLEVHRSRMEISASATISALGLTSEDKALICLPVNYVAGKMMIVRCLMANIETKIDAPSNDPLLPYPIDHYFSFVALVPLQLSIMVKRAGGLEQLCRFKAILLGGAAPSPELREICRVNHLPVWETYGMTETLSHIALKHLGRGEKDFKTLPGIKIGINENSCLWIESTVCEGGRIQTNDIVELHSDNSFLWLGRADHVVNSGGIKLNPESLEDKIKAHFPNLPNFILTGLPDERLGEKLVLLIESNEAFDFDSIKDPLKDLLGSKQVPKECHHLKSFVRTENGKIKRKATSELLLLKG